MSSASALGCLAATSAGTFDLASLALPLRHDAQNWTYSFSVCRDLSALAQREGCASSALTFAAFKTLGSACVGLGAQPAELSASPLVLEGAAGVVVRYGLGAAGSVQLQLTCDDTTSDVDALVLTALPSDRGGTEFTLAVRARAGCPLECEREPLLGMVCGGRDRGLCRGPRIGEGKAHCECFSGFGGPFCAKLSPDSEASASAPSAISGLAAGLLVRALLLVVAGLLLASLAAMWRYGSHTHTYTHLLTRALALALSVFLVSLPGFVGAGGWGATQKKSAGEQQPLLAPPVPGGWPICSPSGGGGSCAAMSTAAARLRVALLFSGQLRIDGGPSFELFNAALLQRHQVDVYAHFWWHPEPINASPWTGSAGRSYPRSYLENFARLYSVRAMAVDPPLGLERLPHPYPNTPSPSSPFNTFSQHVSMLRVYDLMERTRGATTYDSVVRARPDAPPGHFPALELLDRTAMYTHDWGRDPLEYPIIANLVAIMPHDVAAVYMTVSLAANRLYALGVQYNDETLMYAQVVSAGMAGRVKRLSPTYLFMDITRDNRLFGTPFEAVSHGLPFRDCGVVCPQNDSGEYEFSRLPANPGKSRHHTIWYGSWNGSEAVSDRTEAKKILRNGGL